MHAAILTKRYGIDIIRFQKNVAEKYSKLTNSRISNESCVTQRAVGVFSERE